MTEAIAIPFSPPRAASRQVHFPSGWWIVPSFLIGVAMWAAFFVWVFS
jgi:hypothetical protein